MSVTGELSICYIRLPGVLHESYRSIVIELQEGYLSVNECYKRVMEVLQDDEEKNVT